MDAGKVGEEEASAPLDYEIKINKIVCAWYLDNYKKNISPEPNFLLVLLTTINQPFKKNLFDVFNAFSGKTVKSEENMRSHILG